MDRHLEGNLNFRNVVRFGYFMSAGAKHLPNDGGSALHDVLPVELDGIPPTGDGAFYRERFKPRLTAEGQTHPITSLSLDPKVNEKRWDALPGLEGLNRVSRVRPGAGGRGGRGDR